jgi:cobalt/nickel transport system permease protein
MHIADGILSLPVVVGGFGATGVTAWYCLERIKRAGDPREQIPRAALLTAAFFVASLIHIPLPPAGVHLVLNGLLGILLGWFAFPAILVGLFFQAVMFGHGGLTALGVNALILGLGVLSGSVVFCPSWQPTKSPGRSGWRGALVGAGATGGSLLLFIIVLLVGLPADYSQDAARVAITVLAAAHLPLIIIEGTVAGLLVAFLQKVKPSILHVYGP